MDSVQNKIYNRMWCLFSDVIDDLPKGIRIDNYTVCCPYCRCQGWVSFIPIHVKGYRILICNNCENFYKEIM